MSEAPSKPPTYAELEAAYKECVASGNEPNLLDPRSVSPECLEWFKRMGFIEDE